MEKKAIINNPIIYGTSPRLNISIALALPTYCMAKNTTVIRVDIAAENSFKYLLSNLSSKKSPILMYPYFPPNLHILCPKNIIIKATQT